MEYAFFQPILFCNKNKKCIELHLFSVCRFAVLAIRCYQCSTQTDVKGVDSCGAYKRFNASEHIAIECNSDESHMPGSFCMKVVQQGPRGFICKFVAVVPFLMVKIVVSFPFVLSVVVVYSLYQTQMISFYFISKYGNEKIATSKCFQL